MIKNCHKGFALAAVLWLLAGLTIVVALVADIAEKSADRNRLLREKNNFIVNSISVKSKLQYWLSVATPGQNGFSINSAKLRADGVFYEIDDNNLFSLQDHGGLINLSSINRELMRRHLIQCGVIVQEIDNLLDALEDYIDSDNLQRINGAETEVYLRSGMPAPRNSNLLVKDEIWQVFGWEKYREKFENNKCSEDLTIYGETSMLGTSLNLATAPERVLFAAGLSEDQVNDVKNARLDAAKLSDRINEANEFVSTAQGGFGRLSGKYVQRTLTVKHFSKNSPWQWVYILSIDGNYEYSPWKVFYSDFSSSEQDIAGISSLSWPIKEYEVNKYNEKSSNIF